MFNKLCQMIKRSITTQTQSDNTFNPTVKVSSFSNVTDSEVIYPYGYYAVAPVNSQAITLNILGQENNQSSFVYNNTNRFKGLGVGEVQVGGQKTGNSIKFFNNGDINIKNDQGFISLSASNINIEHDKSSILLNDSNIKIKHGVGSISLNTTNMVLKFGTAVFTITELGINCNVPIVSPTP
tara:strand:- start:3900 stop:4445 length:546 start_codon:yes stop_codon:yes gene_type:complete